MATVSWRILCRHFTICIHNIIFITCLVTAHKPQMNDENKIKIRCKNIQVTKNLGFAVIIIIIVKKLRRFLNTSFHKVAYSAVPRWCCWIFYHMHFNSRFAAEFASESVLKIAQRLPKLQRKKRVWYDYSEVLENCANRFRSIKDAGSQTQRHTFFGPLSWPPAYSCSAISARPTDDR